jgi:EpsD family peptidyl-prolyl cis-trans isomerase
LKKKNDQSSENGNRDEVIGSAHPGRLFSQQTGRKRKSSFSKRRVAVVVAIFLLIGAAVVTWRVLSRSSGGVPEGQVVAIVEGHEITTTDLATEARAVGTSIESQASQRAVLEALIDRQLLAKAAVEQGLDRRPQFQAERRRSENLLLARLALEEMAQSSGQPTREQVRGFVAEHPDVFSGRQKLTLEQIRYSPSDALSSAEIAALDTLEESKQMLQSKGVNFEDNSMILDTALLQPTTARQVLRMPTGSLFFLAENGMGVLSKIVSREPAPVSESKQAVIASRVLQEQKAADAVRKRIAAERAKAKLRYQEGFGPPKASSTDNQ